MTSATGSSAQLKVTPTSLPGVLLLEPRVFRDERGFFLESYNQETLAGLGINHHFVQDNHSFSAQNVIRGLHYQICHSQGKLVRVAAGEIFDVVVDLRRSSPAFGKWCGEILSGENNRMLWIPPGFAHGFSVLSPGAHVLYKATDTYHPECERTLAWNDADLNIGWRLSGEPIVSGKDQLGVPLARAEAFV